MLREIYDNFQHCSLKISILSKILNQTLFSWLRMSFFIHIHHVTNWRTLNFMSISLTMSLEKGPCKNLLLCLGSLLKTWCLSTLRLEALKILWYFVWEDLKDATTPPNLAENNSPSQGSYICKMICLPCSHFFSMTRLLNNLGMGCTRKFSRYLLGPVCFCPSPLGPIF